ncbi:uncharacterized protein UHOD_11404 [Ustilago sp. UG-2017b]|nr:uncharacterized protein UHOD_11404 [Ustilago sp. UG-2017b]
MCVVSLLDVNLLSNTCGPVQSLKAVYNTCGPVPSLSVGDNLIAVCHGSECTGSKKALGSYGRSIGVRDQADPQRSRPWPMDEEMLEKAWLECNLHGDHGHGGPGRMHGDPSTATRRTELKEHTDGSHSGARETRVKGTVTGQREGVVYRRPARPANRS